MTTLLLSPVVPNPFSKRFNHKRHRLTDHVSGSTSTVNESSTSLGTVRITTLRQVSAASAPVVLNVTNDENHALQRKSPRPSLGVERKASSLQDSTMSIFNSPQQARTAKLVRLDRVLNLHSSDEPDSTCLGPQDLRTGQNEMVEQESNESNHQHRSDLVGEDLIGPSSRMQFLQGPELLRTAPNKARSEAYDFKRWAHVFRRRKEHVRRNMMHIEEDHALSPERQATIVSASQPCSLLSYRERPSDNSSKFIETLKTASMSNDSLSIIPKNVHWARGHEGRDQRSSHIRYSVDSDRPTTTSSLDEAATRRGVKRRQILQEIAESEEGYVADLRALSNLLSTLLASVSSLSNQARYSIQQNVIEILRVHEDLLHELHLVTLKAAAMKWKDTASPRQFDKYRHVKWCGLNEHKAGVGECRAHHKKSSLGQVDEWSGPMDYVYIADPEETTEVARLFAKLMPSFFIYEEYCAKYEIMVHELANSHKTVPSWSAYETGVEALAKSVIALQNRDADGRKGFTVGDLLIKPIQRICRYPLLLADLLKHTPVVDCPASHADIEGVLHHLEIVIKEINVGTNDPIAKERIKRRWLLESRLNLDKEPFRVCHFRMLGRIILCGVLHVAYQTKNGVEGGYALCVLFSSHLMFAMPGSSGKFNILGIVLLSDIKVDSADDIKGAI